MSEMGSDSEYGTDCGMDANSDDGCDFPDALSDGLPETRSFITIEEQTPLVSEISTLLKNVDVFHSLSGDGDSVLPYSPLIHINDYGLISLPFVKCHATLLEKFLIEKTHNIPDYAKIVDHNSWIIPSNEFKITNELWGSGMENGISKRFSIFPEKMAIELRCMIFRGPGSHSLRKPISQIFPNHDGFANLIIQLPSLYENGRYTLYETDGKKRTEDFGKSIYKNAACPNFVVCYRNDDYELEKIDEGYKVDLVYSISLKDLPLMEVVKHSDSTLLSQSFERMGNEQFVYTCKRVYAETSIAKSGLSCLKGIDFARFRSIVAANDLLSPRKRLKFYIALTQRTLSYYLKRNEETEVGEPIETLNFISWYHQDGNLISPRGHCSEMSTSEILNIDDVPFWELWGETHSSAIKRTRNSSSKICVYRRHAIVGLPISKEFEFLCRYGKRLDAIKKHIFVEGMANIDALRIAVNSYQKDDNAEADILFKHLLNARNEELSLVFIERYLKHMQPQIGHVCFNGNIRSFFVKLAEAYPSVEKKILEELNKSASSPSSESTLRFLLSTITRIEIMKPYDLKHKSLRKVINQLPELCCQIKNDTVFNVLCDELNSGNAQNSQYVMKVFRDYYATRNLAKPPKLISLMKDRMDELFPDAIHANPAVQAFLRGEDRTMTLGNFPGKKAAKNFAMENVGKGKQKNFSANFVWKGNTVVITKNKQGSKATDAARVEWNECKKFVEKINVGVKRAVDDDENENNHDDEPPLKK
ncbi:hypothetical protein HK098_004556 [Nowakowskiella sp. JEL0407]|nr:hypothetical protein HK098_004556 [Nowakowskiella sp. JEL0407]